MLRVVLILTVFAPAAATAQDRYFLYVFSSQSVPTRKPRETHTWATAVRLTADGALPGMVRTDDYTISWMPATLNIRPFALLPEWGRNLDFDESLAFALAAGQRVSVWGPYEIPATIFASFLRRHAELEEAEVTGRIKYKMLQMTGGPKASDCVRAASPLDDLYPGSSFADFRFGDAGSHGIVRNLLRHHPEIDPDARYDALDRAMGLDRYPVERLRFVDRPVNFREPRD